MATLIDSSPLIAMPVILSYSRNPVHDPEYSRHQGTWYSGPRYCH